MANFPNMFAQMREVETNVFRRRYVEREEAIQFLTEDLKRIACGQVEDPVAYAAQSLLGAMMILHNG